MTPLSLSRSPSWLRDSFVLSQAGISTFVAILLTAVTTLVLRYMEYGFVGKFRCR